MNFALISKCGGAIRLFQLLARFDFVLAEQNVLVAHRRKIIYYLSALIKIIEIKLQSASNTHLELASNRFIYPSPKDCSRIIELFRLWECHSLCMCCFKMASLVLF